MYPDVQAEIIEKIDKLNRRLKYLESLEYVSPGPQPSARIYRDSSQAIPDDIGTPISFNQTEWDNDNIFDIAQPTRMTCRTAGKYLVIGNINYDTGGGAGIHRSCYIVRDGLYGAGGTVATVRCAAMTRQANLVVATLWDLGIGDYLELYAHHDQGGPLNVNYYAAYTPRFMMVRVLY